MSAKVKEKTKERLTISIDADLLQSLDRFCKRENRTRSNAVELTIKEFLNSHFKEEKA